MMIATFVQAEVRQVIKELGDMERQYVQIFADLRGDANEGIPITDEMHAAAREVRRVALSQCSNARKIAAILSELDRQAESELVAAAASRVNTTINAA